MNDDISFMDDSTSQGFMPDWDEKQERYIKALRRGRHPASFKRESELWYYVKATNDRLDRIAKGHNLGTILREKDELYYGDGDFSINDENWEFDESSFGDDGSVGSINTHEDSMGDVSSQLTGPGGSGGMRSSRMRSRARSGAATSSRASTRQSVQSTGHGLIADVMAGVNLFSPKRAAKLRPISSPTPLPKVETDTARELINFNLNGVHIDVRKENPLNYGNLVVVMNELNHVLCVDKWGHMRIKSKKQLLFTDKMCFKLVDLRELYNPGEITYGNPFWLQIVETPVKGAPSLNFFQSKILCSKVFDLQTISTQQLDQSWEKNEKRAEIFEREKEVDSDDEYDEKMLEEEMKAHEAKLRADAEEERKSNKGKKKRGWGTVRTKKSGINLIAQLQKKHNNDRKKKEDQAKRKEEEEMDEFGLDSNMRDDENIGDVTGAIISQHMAVNHMLYNDDEPPEPGAAEIVSREALNLGCWVVESAENEMLRMDEDDRAPESGAPLLSNQPVIITQDLYCLADSRGSKYLPWPLRSTDYDMKDPLSIRVKKKKAFLARKQEEALMGTSVSMGSGKKSGKEKSKQSSVNRFAGAANADPDFGVIRHIKKIRRDDSKYNIDHKCVWRFGVIEALEDSSKLTQSELHTAKVMSKAREILRNSEMHRHGEKRYHGSHTNPDETGGYIPPSTIEERKAAKQRKEEERKAAEEAAYEHRLQEEARTAFAANGKEELQKEREARKEEKQKKLEGAEAEAQQEAEEASSPTAGEGGGKDLDDLKGLMGNIGDKKTEEEEEDLRPKIPGGEKFALMLRKNTSEHLRKREEHVLEARRYKEEPEITREFFKEKLTNWDDGTDTFPDDATSLASSVSFDYTPVKHAHSPHHHGQQGGSPTGTDNGVGGRRSPSPIVDGDEGAEQDTHSSPKVVLPVNHREAYEENQLKIYKQKTLVLRRAHYQNYPNFHKDPARKQVDHRTGTLRDPTPLEDHKRLHGNNFAFNDHALSPGMKVLALRQAFDNLETGELDVRAANNGIDHSEVDPRYTTVVRTPATPGLMSSPNMAAGRASMLGSHATGASTATAATSSGEDAENKEEQLARREKEELERQARIAAKIATLQQEDDVIVQALQHRRRDANERELRKMAEKWTSSILSYEEKKSKGNAGAAFEDTAKFLPRARSGDSQDPSETQ